MEKSMFRFSSGFTETSYFAIFMKSIKGIYGSLKDYSAQSGLEFVYVDDERISASAYQNSHGQDCLEINTATMAYTFAYMKTALSSSMIFSEIGDCKNENGAIVAGWFEKEKLRLLFNGTPKDAKRDEFATLLSLMMLRFIATHELGHLYNGHISLLNKEMGINSSSMVMNLNAKAFPRGINALDMRTLEMDADAYAATSGIINTIGLYTDESEKANSLLGQSVPKTEFFKMWAFSVYSLFMIFEGITQTPYSEDSIYLPNEARAILAFDSALQTMDMMRKHRKFNVSDADFKSIEKKIGEGISEAQWHYNRIHGTNYNLIFSAVKNGEYKAYADRVLNHWNNNLKNRLEGHARMMLYDPQRMDEYWNKLP